MFWAREMSALTSQPCYEDLYEWQLFNAAAVGMGLDGKTYFYNNPLTCTGGIIRASWYDIPCCPSNISRTWAALDETILARRGSAYYLNQYISGEAPVGDGDSLVINSKFPWSGEVSVVFKGSKSRRLDLRMRIPA